MVKTSFLCSERIFLRAVEPEDLDMMYEMENDPDMWDISSFTVPYSRYVLREYIQASQADIFADKQLRLMIVRQSDNSVIGIIDITDFVPLHSRGGVGIALRKEYRNQGYAKEALSLLCSYAFDFLNIHQLYAYVAEDNPASIHLFESCGFIRCGFIKEWIQVNGVYKNIILFQCLQAGYGQSV